MSKTKRKGREWWEVYEFIVWYLLEEEFEFVSVWGERERERREVGMWMRKRMCLKMARTRDQSTSQTGLFWSALSVFSPFFLYLQFFKFSSSIIAHYSIMIFFHSSNFFFLNNCTLHNSLIIFFLLWVNFLVTISIQCVWYVV